MKRMGALSVVAALVTGPVFGQSAPGGVEITCNADRKVFRKEVKFELDVTFRLYDAEVGGSQCGPDYVVSIDDLRVFKQKSDKFADRKPIKFSAIMAILGSDLSPAQLCPGSETWVDITVGGTTLTCAYDEDDNSRQPPPPPARRRLPSVPFTKTSGPGPVAVSASVYHNNGLLLADNTETPIPFESEFFDIGDLHGQLSNTSRIAVPSAGKYLVTGTLCYRPSNPPLATPGRRKVSVRVNGSAVHFAGAAVPAVSDQRTFVSTSTVLDLNGGDYVELFGLQDSGQSVELCTGETPNFSVFRLGD